MSKRKSGDQTAESPSLPVIVCVLVVDNTFDEFEVENLLPTNRWS